ncbi:MAG: antitoxin HicB [Actinomycetaceae bacterium]|nr:antitoxin HicB [Actinomycetaceae bacterium]
MKPETKNSPLSPPLNVTARKWHGGWELEIVPDAHYTQVAHLSQAHKQVLDYLDTVWPEDEKEHEEWEINIIPDLASLSNDLIAARKKMQEADEIRKQAAEATRQAVIALKQKGIAQSDIAFLMGVSRARVSQLVATA